MDESSRKPKVDSTKPTKSKVNNVQSSSKFKIESVRIEQCSKIPDSESRKEKSPNLKKIVSKKIESKIESLRIEQCSKIPDSESKKEINPNLKPAPSKLPFKSSQPSLTPIISSTSTKIDISSPKIGVVKGAFKSPLMNGLSPKLGANSSTSQGKLRLGLSRKTNIKPLHPNMVK